MSQRELAGKAGIDFTYLSKIENGTKPPPSEKVILVLAHTLGIGSDELFSLAGKVPSDLAEVLKEPGILPLLRSKYSRRIIASSDKKRRKLQVPINFKNLIRKLR